MSDKIKEHVLHIVEQLNNEEFDLYDEGGLLDIEYTLNSHREFIGARLLIAFGGPNIWIDTRTSTVEGYWWNDSYKAQYDYDYLHEQCEEYYNCY